MFQTIFSQESPSGPGIGPRRDPPHETDAAADDVRETH